MIHAALFGLAIGDALGVPVEFRKREAIRLNPVTDMIGYGTHNQPAGTWSDDSSLAFCLTEALTKDFDMETISQNFQKWYYENWWTPHGNIFDIGFTTRQAIQNMHTGCRPDLAGGMDETENGNGSLMRILPLVFYIQQQPIDERYLYSKHVSALTHAHARSVIACFYYLEFARQLLTGEDVLTIYKNLQQSIPAYLKSLNMNIVEIRKFDRLLLGNIYELSQREIYSSGYVLHTLEASIWCLFTTSSYKEAVLKAVNLGDDTDTTGAVTGGLAGLLYGFDAIPLDWIRQLARWEDIQNLADRLSEKFEKL